jgi:hypothetical protein
MKGDAKHYFGNNLKETDYKEKTERQIQIYMVERIN